MRNYTSLAQSLTITLILTSIGACRGWRHYERIRKREIGRDSNATLEVVVAKLAIDERVESALIGEGGDESLQFARYVRMKQIATDSQLVTLSNHPSPAVRCYAFQALAANHSPHVFEVLERLWNDTTTVITQEGCMVGHQSVGSYFLEVVTTDFIGTNLYRLDSAEIKKLDSLKARK